MMRIFVALVALSGLAACGGGSRYSSMNAGVYRPAPVLFARGPIQQACETQGRRAATPARCGCVQAIANQSLSRSEQRRAAKMFKDPHEFQEMRQSNNPKHEQFWRAWKTFGQNAAAACDRT
ncbi:hypothetical protein ACFSUD_12750 [Sulfitobacter aestuarii]|uniref:Arginine transporter n=1 Tax=Sulfitobacter aestuarii TaxID=2161676 RepID=A0ABW5U3M1_9RHOB